MEQEDVTSTNLPAAKKRKLEQESDDVDIPKYADPTIDVAFYKLFADENNKDILISFLNSLLNFSGEREIESIVINSPVNVNEKGATKLHEKGAT